MPKNNNLQAAKKAKNDEFYTQYSDIEKELQHYTQHFAGKVIYCNCDNPEWSNFWKYFHENFTRLKLKKLIASFYDPNAPVYYMTYEGGNDADFNIGTTTPLQQNGDFRSPECVELLKEADIVVTNPMFSLFREYIAQLVEYNKKFVIMGNMNAITYKEFFPLIKDGKVWAGYGFNTTMIFAVPDSYNTEKNVGSDEFGRKLVKVPAICWYTNLDIPKRHEPIDLVEHYDPERYPTYSNYDAIECSRTLDIPCDYEPCWYKCPHATNCVYAQTEGKEDKALCEQACNGEMGVPISYIDKHTDQFEIIGTSRQLGKPMSEVAPKGTYEPGGVRFYLPAGSSQSVKKNSLIDVSTTELLSGSETLSKIVRQNHHSPDAISATELLECQSLISQTIQTSSESSDCLQKQLEKHLSKGPQPTQMKNTNIASVQSLQENVYTRESLFKGCHKCNGAMGVPISFLDKYCPDQFIIIGLGITESGIACGVRTNYSEVQLKKFKQDSNAFRQGTLFYLENNKAKVPYARILIHRRKEQSI